MSLFTVSSQGSVCQTPGAESCQLLSFHLPSTVAVTLEDRTFPSMHCSCVDEVLASEPLIAVAGREQGAGKCSLLFGAVWVVPPERQRLLLTVHM